MGALPLTEQCCCTYKNSCQVSLQVLHSCAGASGMYWHGWLPNPVLSENHKNTDEDLFHYKVVLFWGKIGLQCMQTSYRSSLKSSFSSWADMPKQLSGCRGTDSLVFGEPSGERTFVCGERAFWQHFPSVQKPKVVLGWQHLGNNEAQTCFCAHLYGVPVIIWGWALRESNRMLSAKGVAFYSLLSPSNVILLTLFSTFSSLHI